MAIMHGGFDEEGEHISDTYLLDLTQMTWIKLDLPSIPSISSITNLAESIFVFGGITMKDHLLDYSILSLIILKIKTVFPRLMNHQSSLMINQSLFNHNKIK
jgi:hypothetical protein